jgi:trk system potassium uptake protein
VHLWRAMVGWAGGLFILVAASAILAPINLGGVELTTGSVLGRGQGSGIFGGNAAHPYLRFLTTGAVVLPAYVGLTLVLWVGLLIFGAPALDGLCQAMSTLSTSGIRCGPLPGAGNAGLGGEVLIFAFLTIALSRRLLPGQSVVDRAPSLWTDPELRLAATVLLLFALLMVFKSAVLDDQTGGDDAPFRLIRDLWAALFTGLSYLTTHGIVSAHWSLPETTQVGSSSVGLVLLGLAIFGGGAATTAGGVKLLRVHALIQQAQRELERIVHPNSIGGKGQYARRLRREGAYFAWIFFLIFAVSLGGIVLALGLFGLPFEPALVLAVAALTTTGPLILTANEVPIDLIGQSGSVKTLLSMAMILGRIEILALIAVVSMGEQRR